MQNMPIFRVEPTGTKRENLCAHTESPPCENPACCFGYAPPPIMQPLENQSETKKKPGGGKTKTRWHKPQMGWDIQFPVAATQWQKSPKSKQIRLEKNVVFFAE
jgi:hypothetical protein